MCFVVRRRDGGGWVGGWVSGKIWVGGSPPPRPLQWGWDVSGILGGLPFVSISRKQSKDSSNDDAVIFQMAQAPPIHHVTQTVTTLNRRIVCDKISEILLPSASPPRRESTPSNTPKIGYKLHKYGLKHALHILDSHFR